MRYHLLDAPRLSRVIHACRAEDSDFSTIEPLHENQNTRPDRGDRVIHARVSRFSSVFPLITEHVDGAKCTRRARSIVIRGIVVGVVKT